MSRALARVMYGIQTTTFLLIFVILVAPIFWMLFLSFQPYSVILGGVKTLGSVGLTLDHYRSVFRQTSLLRWIRNSVLVTSATMTVGLSLGVFGGYFLGRVRSKLSYWITISLLLAQTLPPTLLIIPMYLFLRRWLGISSVPVLLVITHVSRSLPLVTWFIANYIRRILPELEEAARIDGCNWTQILLYIVVPIIKPSIAAASVLIFIASWGDFIWGFIFTSHERDFLLGVAVQQFTVQFAVLQTGILLAIAVIYTIPAVAFFYIVHKHMVRGLSAGAVKG